MEWILVAYIYAGVLAKGDSVTLESIRGFKSEISCNQAGQALTPLTASSTKEFRFVCVKQ